MAATEELLAANVAGLDTAPGAVGVVDVSGPVRPEDTPGPLARVPAQLRRAVPVDRLTSSACWK